MLSLAESPVSCSCVQCVVASLFPPLRSPLPPAGASPPSRLRWLRLLRRRAGSAPSGARGACSAGCPCRAPAAVSPPRHQARRQPLTGSRLSLRSAQRLSLRSVFFGWRVALRLGSAGVSPRSQPREVCPLQPLAECPLSALIFCLARGARVAPCRARGYAPAPLAGGVFAAPLHPLRPRRGGRCFS